MKIRVAVIDDEPLATMQCAAISRVGPLIWRLLRNAAMVTAAVAVDLQQVT